MRKHAIALYNRICAVRVTVPVAHLIVIVIAAFVVGRINGCHRPAKPAEVAKATAPEQKPEAKPAEKPLTLPSPPLDGKGLPVMPLLPTAKGLLTGMVVVIDPGHGGADPGCGWSFSYEGKTYPFAESSITYPASWQLAQSLVSKGATVYLTAWSPKMLERPANAQTPPPEPSDAVWLLNEARGKSLRPNVYWPRTELAVEVEKKFAKLGKTLGWRHVAFVSVHVDSEGNESITGAHVLWHGYPDLARPIAGELEAEHLGWTAAKGDGLPMRERRVFVLRKNPLRLAALIEMGVPGNDPGDSWRLRDADSRQKVLDCVVRGLEQVNTP